MNAAPPPSEDAVLLVLDRSSRDRPDTERLVIAVRSYQGTRYLDARLQFRGDDGTWRPTKRGVTVRPRELEQAAKALEQAAAMLRERG